MRLNQNRLRELLLLAGLCGFLFFFRLGGFGLLGPDEPRYAQVAREMLARHNWITPYLYGHAWLEKPILLYWGEMLSYLLYGVSDWAARVPSAVAAAVMVCGTFWAVRRIRYTARLDAALMVASSALVLGFARAAATDMLLAAPYALGLLAWFVWYQAPEENRRWLLAAYFFNAVATLAKGPVAIVLDSTTLILFCALRRDWRSLGRSLNLWGVAIFLAVAAPWYLLVQAQTPEFFRIFFLQHNLARFGTNLYRHRQPFWYYLPVALAASVPWTVWVLHGVTDAVKALPKPEESRSSQVSSATLREPFDELRAGSGQPSFDFERFLLVWAMVPIVFFSLSHSKLPGYILPAIPALLILGAVAVHRRAARDERPHWAAICAHAALMAALAAGVCAAPRLMLKLPLSPAALMTAALAGTLVFLLCAVGMLAADWRMLRLATLLPLILIVGFLLRGLAPLVDATQSARPVAELIAALSPADSEPVATFNLSRNTTFGLAFYLDRRVSAYEGLEISPAVYELPPAVPTAAHLLVAREKSMLSVLLPGRRVRWIGADRAQHIEIFRVGASE
jgi:4-amino-4-deoxy-L-arabinose transferase-like glycosyltransferase